MYPGFFADPNPDPDLKNPDPDPDFKAPDPDPDFKASDPDPSIFCFNLQKRTNGI